MSGPTVLVVAAEASGDQLGADLIAALRRRDPALRFVGVGGARMREAGVDSPFDIAELSVLGIVEGLLAYPRVLRRTADVGRLAERERPDAAVLIDSWGFTLRAARRLRRVDPHMLLVKYVAPQVWASRAGRARTLAASVDHLLSIHAVDRPYFEAAGLPLTFVGNPALARDLSRGDPARLRAQLGLAADRRIVLLLPGSRPAEVRRLLPDFLEAARRLAQGREDLAFVLPAADTVAAEVEALLAGAPLAVRLVRGEEGRFDAMRAAAFALACSGTVTTELALAGCPMVVAYKVGPVTYAILRRLITTPYATLFNIAAGEAVAPELLQGACTPEALAREAALRLDDPSRLEAQARRQTAALALMGAGGADPADRAAEAVLALLEARRAGVSRAPRGG